MLGGHKIIVHNVVFCTIVPRSPSILCNLNLCLRGITSTQNFHMTSVE